MELVLTDMQSPSRSSPAGLQLSENLQRLSACGFNVEPIRQDVNAFLVPEDLLCSDLFLMGSPANHSPENKRFEHVHNNNNVAFKSEVFYSLCYYTHPESVVVMSYSASACVPGLEFWTDYNIDAPARALVVTPAWFKDQPFVSVGLSVSGVR